MGFSPWKIFIFVAAISCKVCKTIQVASRTPQTFPPARIMKILMKILTANTCCKTKVYNYINYINYNTHKYLRHSTYSTSSIHAFSFLFFHRSLDSDKSDSSILIALFIRLQKSTEFNLVISWKDLLKLPYTTATLPFPIFEYISTVQDPNIPS